MEIKKANGTKNADGVDKNGRAKQASKMFWEKEQHVLFVTAYVWKRKKEGFRRRVGGGGAEECGLVQ